MSDIFINALETPWTAFDIVGYLTDQPEINDALLTKTGTLIYRKETVHYLSVIASWVTELCAAQMRQLYAVFYGRTNRRNADSAVMDPSTSQALANARRSARPFLLFHQSTRLALQRLCIFTRYLRLNLGMHGKNIIEGGIRGANLAYEKFHLGVQDGALQRVRVKVEAMANFLRAVGQAIQSEGGGEGAASKMEEDRRGSIRGTVPEHALRALPAVKMLYESMLVKVFAPPPAPAGVVPPAWNREKAVRAMFMAGNEKWMEMGRGRDKSLPELAVPASTQKRGVGSLLGDQEGDALSGLLSDILLGIRDRYDVIGKAHLGTALSIKQCLRCCNCSIAGGDGDSSLSSSKRDPATVKLEGDTTVKTEDGKQPEQSGGKTAPAYKGSPPWKDAFAVSCICGGKWWKVLDPT
ncbi:hypothetical protein HDV00_011132 [Rhizophlyctis rosea]|nr:hypothetical protein HDV00_011132 [Rhizophlyctis rosea]